MICSICGDREAVLLLRPDEGRAVARVDGQPGAETTVALCGECAARRGLLGPGPADDVRRGPGLSLGDLLGGARSAGLPRACPGCGATLEALRLEARIGCPRCADAFRPEIDRYLRARAKPPFYREGGGAGPSRPEGLREGLLVRLGRALAAEDYEEAARLRDAGQGLAPASPPPPGGGPESLLDLGSLNPLCDLESSRAVVWTRGALLRNLEGLAFPSPQGQVLPPAVVNLLWAGGAVHRLGDLPPGLPEALAEAGVLPSRAAAAPPSLLGLSALASTCILAGSSSHLEARHRGRGLCPQAALEAVRTVLAPFAATCAFAFDEDFGFLAPSLKDCGSGFSCASLVHLPALAWEGQLPRALKGVLSRGYRVEAFYPEVGPEDEREGGGEGPVAGPGDGQAAGGRVAGDLYLVATERAFGQSAEDLARDFELALGALSLAERKAREGLLEVARDEVLDGAGRALGLFRYGRYLELREAADGLSVLRLAALGGLAPGLDLEGVDDVLSCLGGASMEYYYRCGADRSGHDRREAGLRASLLAAVTASAALEEGDSRCSED